MIISLLVLDTILVNIIQFHQYILYTKITRTDVDLVAFSFVVTSSVFLSSETEQKNVSRSAHYLLLPSLRVFLATLFFLQYYSFTGQKCIEKRCTLELFSIQFCPLLYFFQSLFLLDKITRTDGLPELLKRI